MTLQRKIIASFLVSSIIIAGFVMTALLSFIEIKKEIRYLELSDSIRTKSLQIRRHEKNYFLYRDAKELDEVHRYIGETYGLIEEGRRFDSRGDIGAFEKDLRQYEAVFNEIASEIAAIEVELKSIDIGQPYPLLNAAFVERPLLSAKFIRQHAPSLTALPQRLEALSERILALRKVGEDMINVSREIDKSARQKVERAIAISQTAAVIIFPLFFGVGLLGLFIVGRGVVHRLNELTVAAGKTGRGEFAALDVAHKDDEVGLLIEAFNKMEGDLKARDEVIKQKNEELFHSRKLASIGTLASGVAHELNNPLNNIYLSAQVLMKEIKDDSPPMVQETVEDIYSETLRVKRIVNDLLEFARSKPPAKGPVDVSVLVVSTLNNRRAHRNPQDIGFEVDVPQGCMVTADPHMLEQVFINLIDNALDAMKDRGGTLRIEVGPRIDTVEIAIEDTGPGIPETHLQKVFDPFFTTKDKGTGLGLSIVYSIIEKHSGTVQVLSTEGKGTRFTITLPKEG